MRVVILERLALPGFYLYSRDGKPAMYSGPVEPQPKPCKRSASDNSVVLQRIQTHLNPLPTRRNKSMAILTTCFDATGHVPWTCMID